MKKLIIIPAYNESECIVNTVQMIREAAPDFDYLVVNDCSKDNTAELCAENHFNYVDLPINLGIGGAVQTGYRYAYENGYDVAVQMDGDGQHDGRYLSDMFNTLVEENADMVIGSRFIKKEGFQSSFLRRVGISYFTGLLKLLSGKVVTDPTSGFRMINRKQIENFAFNYPRDYPEPESTAYLLKRGCKVVEVPMEMKERQGGVSSIRFQKTIYYMVKVTLAIIIEWLR